MRCPNCNNPLRFVANLDIADAVDYVFETPEQLILHFDKLGVTQKGLVGEDPLEIKEKIEYKFFPSEKCIICYDHKPNVVYISCGHNNICDHCYQNLDPDTMDCCPLCRTSSTYVLIRNK